MKYEELVVIKSNFSLAPADYDVLSLLYAPLMGPKALSIYMCMSAMISRGDRVSIEYKVAQFCDLYNFTPLDLSNAIKKLEGIGLLRSFIETNHYIFILQPPLSAKNFLTDGVLGIYLYGTIGEEAYQNIKSHFQLPKLIENFYEEKTLSFDEVYTDKIGVEQKEKLADLFGKSSGNAVVIKNLEFDYNKFEKNINEDYIPKKRKEFKQSILNTAYVYGFDEFEMESIVKESVDQRGYYNTTNIRKKASLKYQFIYNSAPKLRNKYSSFEDYRILETITSTNLLDEVITDDAHTSYFADYLKQIDELYTKLLDRFSRGVINCMIIYALQNNEFNLPNNTYFMKMADTWENEYNIKKIEDAVTFITTAKIDNRKKNYKKGSKTNVKPTEKWAEEMSQNVEEGFSTL